MFFRKKNLHFLVIFKIYPVKAYCHYITKNAAIWSDEV